MELELKLLGQHLLVIAVGFAGVYTGYRLADPEPLRPQNTTNRAIDTMFATLGMLFLFNELTTWLFQWSIPYRSYWLYVGLAAGFGVLLRGTETPAY